jgi:hypothetical protein
MPLTEATQFYSALLANGDVMQGPVHLTRIEGDAGLSYVVVATNEELVVPITSVIYLRFRESPPAEPDQNGKAGGA